MPVQVWLQSAVVKPPPQVRTWQRTRTEAARKPMCDRPRTRRRVQQQFTRATWSREIPLVAALLVATTARLAVSAWTLRETWGEPTMLLGRRCCNGRRSPRRLPLDLGSWSQTEAATHANGGRWSRPWVACRALPAGLPPPLRPATNPASRGHAGPTHVAGGRGRGGADAHVTGSVRSTPDALAARTRPRCAEGSRPALRRPSARMAQACTHPPHAQQHVLSP